jgi:hypothetical protein
VPDSLELFVVHDFFDRQSSSHGLHHAVLTGGNTLTFTAAVGASVELLAVSATVWGLIGSGGAALSTV